jgi:hypothetical protein
VSHRKITLIERTLWIAKCACGEQKEWADGGRKEWRCPACKTWVPVERQTFTSEEYHK